MHEAPKDLSGYRKDIDEALEDSFLHETLDNFAVSYRANREEVFRDVDEKGLIRRIADARDNACRHMEELYARFKEEAEKRGAHVHRAADAAEANRIIADIAAENGVRRIIKSKSMTAEEIRLNAFLESKGFQVDETDLGEWIVQLRHEGPSHMVMPAIHLSRRQIARDFESATGKRQEPDVQKLVKVARVQLRRKFVEGDMGVTGCNFAIAENGAVSTVTNEGNAELVATLPPVHVVLVGLDKLVSSLDDALVALQVLPRNATAQRLTAYVSLVDGAVDCAASPDGRKKLHMVFLDNGRSEIAADPVFSQIFRCVRCGACANVCPVYRLVGGHRMGHIYIGAIGLVLTYLFHGSENARVLCQNCVGCEACANVCAGGIDLPGLIREVRARLAQDGGQGVAPTLLSAIMKNRRLFHSLLKFARFAQKPVTGNTQFLRHLPAMFLGKHGYKALPAIAERPFRDLWPEIAPRLSNPDMRVAIFGGCAQDFVYPEQLEACVKVLAARNVSADFPMDQSCCGLPLEMMGQRKTSIEVARQNVRAFESGGYDYIVTLCASCASHLRHAYPKLLGNEPERESARDFAERVIDFSSFARDKLGLSASDFGNSGEDVTYHASCHLCRGLNVRDAPRELIAGAANYVPCPEEETCCGFGGTYSMKFPEISGRLMERKLENIASTGAGKVVADCPGCIMQIRGGAEKRGLPLRVQHIAELVADSLKK